MAPFAPLWKWLQQEPYWNGCPAGKYRQCFWVGNFICSKYWYAVLSMKKRIKNVKRKKSQPKDDNYLLRIRKGELLYKFYYFRPVAGRREHFEYRILTKEKTDGMLEMVSYNFKIVSGVPQKSSIARVLRFQKTN